MGMQIPMAYFTHTTYKAHFDNYSNFRHTIFSLIKKERPLTPIFRSMPRGPRTKAKSGIPPLNAFVNKNSLKSYRMRTYRTKGKKKKPNGIRQN